VYEIECNTQDASVPTTTLQIIVDASDPATALSVVLQKMELELPHDKLAFQIPDDCKSVHRKLKDKHDMHVALALMKDKMAHTKMKLKILTIFNDVHVSIFGEYFTNWELSATYGEREDLMRQEETMLSTATLFGTVWQVAGCIHEIENCPRMFCRPSL
jgi:hypothetical protein